MTNSNSKRCPDCEQVLSVEEFYKRSDGTPGTYCKKCANIRTRNNPNRFEERKHIPLIASERDAITKLESLGIPVMPAKAFGHTYGDILAWGCIGIEVKSANLINGSFLWGFSPRQRKHGIRGSILILIAYNDNEVSMYVFDAKDPLFYDDNGKLKTCAQWTPNRANGGRKSLLTDEVMNQHQGAWHILRNKFTAALTHLQHGGSTLDLLR